MTPEKLREYYTKVNERYGYTDSYETWLSERYRCQTDLFYLAKTELGLDLADNFVCIDHRDNPESWSDLPEQICPVCSRELEWYSGIEGQMSLHRLMCDFFVHKNPNTHPFNLDQTKNRLMMIPRGSFKSSINQADCVQWIITFPDIRIGLLTAAEDLAIEFIAKVKSYFQFIEDENGVKTLTHFQKLFPEHAVSIKKKEKEDRFTTEGRTRKITDPTLRALSLLGTKSGKHCDVGKYDDCVSDKNSGPGTSQDTRDDVGAQIRLARSLVEPAGYHDNIGTPYDEQDAYSDQIARAKSAGSELKSLIIPARAVREESKKKKPEELSEGDWHLLFPYDGKGLPRLTYRFLQDAASDPVNFSCQYLCNPESSKIVKFTEHMLNSHIIDDTMLPQIYKIVNAWDFAYVAASGRDYSVGIQAHYDLNNGRMVVMDIVRGRFSKSELAYQVAKLAVVSSAQLIAIEGTNGANFLENDIRLEMRKLGRHECSMEFFPVDTKKGAKEARAEMLETLLVNDRMFFRKNMPGKLDDLIQEFLKFKPSAKRKDDCVDAVAHAARYIPPVDLPASEVARRQEIYDILREKQHFERIYNRPDPAEPQAPPPTTHYEGLPISCPRCGFGVCIC